MIKNTKEIYDMVESAKHQRGLFENCEWIRVDKTKEWFLSQRQLPNDMFTIERLINKFDELLSQSRESDSSNGIQADDVASQDSRDNGLGVETQGCESLGESTTSKPDYIHYCSKFNDGTLCGVSVILESTSNDWKHVNCPDCLKHKPKEAGK